MFSFDLTKRDLSLTFTKEYLLPKPNHRQESGCKHQALESHTSTLYPVTPLPFPSLPLHVTVFGLVNVVNLHRSFSFFSQEINYS